MNFEYKLYDKVIFFYRIWYTLILQPCFINPICNTRGHHSINGKPVTSDKPLTKKRRVIAPTHTVLSYSAIKTITLDGKLSQYFYLVSYDIAAHYKVMDYDEPPKSTSISKGVVEKNGVVTSISLYGAVSFLIPIYHECTERSVPRVDKLYFFSIYSWKDIPWTGVSFLKFWLFMIFKYIHIY